MTKPADVDVPPPADVRAMLQRANLPSVVMALFHLTGDRRWLEAPYRPTLPDGLDPHDGGGFPPRVAEEIIEAAGEAFDAWARGKPAACPDPTLDELQEMMCVATGEQVPYEYAEMMTVEMGFRPRPAPVVSTNPTAGGRLPYLVVGAGVSGLYVIRLLRDAGVEFRIVEKNDRLGGTWYENAYPGAGVDTPSYLYSFSDHLHDWSQHFAKRDEIYEYIVSFAESHDLVDLVEFDTEVVEASYREDERCWEVSLEGAEGREVGRFRGVITATGFLNRPKVPDFTGLEDFDGEAFHSARWPADLDLSDKRVAVIGTGASAMQIVPAIVDQIDHLTIFQRSPQWAAPTPLYFEPVDEAFHWLTRSLPYYHAWYRFRLAWTFMDRLHGSWQIDPDWRGVQRAVSPRNDGHRRAFESYIREQLEGHDELLEVAIPDYPPFAKRMLLDNGWYAALKRHNVSLVTEPVTGFTSSGLVTPDGTQIDADIAVICTGFEAQRPLFPMRIVGRDGVELREAWNDDDARAHLGITTPGFPNLFMMYGPNTNPGGGSYLMMAELQARYIVELIAMAARSGASAVEPDRDRFEAYNQEVDAAHEQMIWSHRGVDTYYRNQAGRVVTNMPWRVVDYWKMLQEVDPGDYRLVR